MKYLNLLTLGLALLKLFGFIHVGWLIVFIPTFIYLGALLIALLFLALVFKTAGKEVIKSIKDELEDWPN